MNYNTFKVLISEFLLKSQNFLFFLVLIATFPAGDLVIYISTMISVAYLSTLGGFEFWREVEVQQPTCESTIPFLMITFVMFNIGVLTTFVAALNSTFQWLEYSPVMLLNIYILSLKTVLLTLALVCHKNRGSNDKILYFALMQTMCIVFAFINVEEIERIILIKASAETLLITIFIAPLINFKKRSFLIMLRSYKNSFNFVLLSLKSTFFNTVDRAFVLGTASPDVATGYAFASQVATVLKPISSTIYRIFSVDILNGKNVKLHFNKMKVTFVALGYVVAIFASGELYHVISGNKVNRYVLVILCCVPIVKTFRPILNLLIKQKEYKFIQYLDVSISVCLYVILVLVGQYFFGETGIALATLSIHILSFAIAYTLYKKMGKNDYY